MKTTTGTARFTLHIDKGGSYPLASMRATYAANGVNSALVDLAIGLSNGQPVDPRFKRGQYCSISRDTTTIFRGVIDDFGPSNLQFGAFTFQVMILGRLSLLASGTLQSSSVIPKSYLDNLVDIVDFLGNVPKYSLKEEIVKPDLLIPLKEAFINIATDKSAPEDSLTQTIQDLFGTETNYLAAQIMSEIRGSLLWNTDSEILASGIGERINQFFSTNWMLESFFTKLVSIGEMLRFSVVENANDIFVVPYVPFYNESLNSYKRIQASEYNALTWDLMNFNNYKGVVLTNSTTNTGRPDKDAFLAGYYKRTQNIGNFGRVMVTGAPDFLGEAMDPTFAPDAGRARTNTITTDAKKVCDKLARIMCWEGNYGGRQVTVNCPYIRTDIAPLTPVRIEFPSIPGIAEAVETPTIYGSVQKVVIAADASREFAATTYQISYVHSSEVQRNEINEAYTGHPFWQLKNGGITPFKLGLTSTDLE